MFLLVIIEGFNGGGIMHALAAAFGESCAILLIPSAASALYNRDCYGLIHHQKRRECGVFDGGKRMAKQAVIAKMLIFSYRRMIMAYSPDFRKKVLETLSRGLSVRTTAALFGIHFTTIQNWKKHPEKAKTPQKRPPKKIRTEELLVDIEMYPTDYLSERAKRFKCTPAAIRKAMLRNKFSKKRRY